MKHNRFTIWVCTVVLFTVSFLSVFLTQDDYGPHWDAHTYYPPASRFGMWMRSHWTGEDVPSISDIDAYFPWNRDHPPLGKILMGMTYALFAKTIGEADATGLAVLLCFATLVSTVFLVCHDSMGFMPALFGAMMMWFMPRVFCHAHLIALDLIVTPLILISVFAFAKNASRKLGFIVPGLCLGLALLTKLQAAFVPLILCFWLVWGCLLEKDQKNQRMWTPWINLLLSGLLGMVILIAGWPFLWGDMRGNLKIYWEFLSVRKDLDVFYFGQRTAGWTYPFVMTLITTPPAALITALFATRSFLQRKAHPSTRLWLCGIVVPLAVIAMPGVKRYDGIRLFMPFLPFLVCLSAAGFRTILRHIEIRIPTVARQKILALAFLVLLPGSALIELIIYHPHQIVYYSPLIGGFPGAYLAGMDADYLGLCIQESLPVVHARVPKGSWLFLAGVNTANQFSPVSLPDPGAPVDLSLNSTYRVASVPMTQDILDSPWGMYTLINNRRGGLGEVGDIIVSQQMPIWEYEFQGVPLLMLYAYPKRGAYDAGARYVFEHIEALDVLWHDDEEELQIIWRLRESAPSLGLFIDQVDSGRRVLERTHQERLYSLYPTEFWLPGDTIRTRYPILLQPRTETFEIRIIERESEREEGLIRMKVSH